MSKDLLEAFRDRRSIYSINSEAPLSDEAIVELVQFAVKYCPTSFNVQSGRAVVLLGEEHLKLWDIVKESLRPLVPADSFAQTEQKLDAFRSGHGTVLYFEDRVPVEKFQAQFPLYSDNFPVWSLQSSGMLQYMVWTLLESKGLGATLQHYNPVIDEKVKETWNIPESWKLLAQMPFGKPTADPGEKEFMPIEERVKVFK